MSKYNFILFLFLSITIKGFSQSIDESILIQIYHDIKKKNTYYSLMEKIKDDIEVSIDPVQWEVEIKYLPTLDEDLKKEFESYPYEERLKIVETSEPISLVDTLEIVDESFFFPSNEIILDEEKAVIRVLKKMDDSSSIKVLTAGIRNNKLCITLVEVEKEYIYYNFCFKIVGEGFQLIITDY